MRLQVRANRTRSDETCHDLLQDDRLRAATRGLVDADGNRALIQYNSLSEVAESKNQLAPPMLGAPPPKHPSGREYRASRLACSSQAFFSAATRVQAVWIDPSAVARQPEPPILPNLHHPHRLPDGEGKLRILQAARMLPRKPWLELSYGA